jgi:UDP-N-acetylmuramate--alanine ligase
MKHTQKRIHMIGIGGAGMSPIAELLFNLGYIVTGSDRQKSDASVRLESLGIVVQYHHEPDLIAHAELVVYSSAIRETNPERLFAAAHSLRQIRRAEMLGDLMRAQTTVCISGTHGKTTTTSLTGTILYHAKLDPTVLIGGMLRVHGTHAMIGHGNIMVAEADEFDRSFLAMYPTIAVITNIDADHLDCYRDLNDIKEAFTAFTRRVPFYGNVIACIDDPGVRDIIPAITAPVTTYGIDSGNPDVTARNIHFTNGCATFDVVENGVEKGTVSLTVPGMHNVRNALAAIAVASIFDVEMAVIGRALAGFGGVHRRFEQRAVVNGVAIIDDYAHHPREIQATLDAARRMCSGRVIAVFQPHLFTRTRDFLADFADTLCAADYVYVTGIYKSREDPLPGVTAEAIVDKLKSSGHEHAYFAADRDLLVATLRDAARSGDMVLFMGAGDINETASRLIGVLNDKT